MYLFGSPKEDERYLLFVVTESVDAAIFNEASNNSVDCRVASFYIFGNTEYCLTLHLVFVDYGYALLVGNEAHFRFTFSFYDHYSLI